MRTVVAFLVLLMGWDLSTAFLLLPGSLATTVRSVSRQGTPLYHSVSPAIADEADKADIPPLKELVPAVTLESVDLRAGRVVMAEYVPDPSHENKPSRKYLSLLVDIGLEKRKVVAAVRSIFDPEDIIGKAVLMAVNTEPETILGLPSQGRVMYISHYSKQPMPRTLRDVLLSPGAPPPGSTVKGA